jgi:hypothetical protein
VTSPDGIRTAPPSLTAWMVPSATRRRTLAGDMASACATSPTRSASGGLVVTVIRTLYQSLRHAWRC